MEITQLQMVEKAINDILSLQLNSCSIIKENRCKNWHIFIKNAMNV